MIIDTGPGKLICILFALICAIEDIAERKTDILVFISMMFFEILVFIYMIIKGEPIIYSELLGATAGIPVLILSIVTNGAVGTGDAIYFILTGFALGIKYNIILLATVIFLCGISSLIICASRMFSGYSRMNMKKYTHPMLAYAAPVMLVISFLGGPK